MGKYSLESYERYHTVRARPAVRAGEAANRFVTLRVTPEDRPAFGVQTLMEVFVSKDAYASSAEAESAVRALAAATCRESALLGVTLICDAGPSVKRSLWETAAGAFAPKRFYVPVTDGEQLDYMLKRDLAGGLYVRVGDNPYDVCEAFAENEAQRLYRRMPVLVSFARHEPALAKYAEQWHANAVEGLDAPAGWRIALRRLTYPAKLTCGGFAPLRFWWTNSGPGFCHDPLELRLRLCGCGLCAPVAVNDRPCRIPLADRAHNEIVRLPQIAPGEYTLEYGLFAADGRPVELANEDAASDGYYVAGTVSLDETPRPELEHAWDDYAPDGYYPLEDPKQPA